MGMSTMNVKRISYGLPSIWLFLRLASRRCYAGTYVAHGHGKDMPKSAHV